MFAELNIENLLIVILAIVWDLSLGEPPYWMHPVVGIGKIISVEMRLAPFRRSPRFQFFYGLLIVLLTVSFLLFIAYVGLVLLREFHTLAYIVAGAFLLKSSFSLRSLHAVALKVKRSLELSELERARLYLKALVGRDTSTLEKPLLVSATVESVAENTNDSFVGPLFFFLIFGVTGAVGYRVANTYDSMIGYRGNYEYLGKFAAKLDDVLNYIPARLTALLIVFAALVSRKSAWTSLKVLVRDHNNTRSPNAGWPMSAAAGALQVQLEKAGHYKLGDQGSTLSTNLISAGTRLMFIAALCWIMLVLSVIVVRSVYNL